jgi:hypothetical protein
MSVPFAVVVIIEATELFWRARLLDLARLSHSELEQPNPPVNLNIASNHGKLFTIPLLQMFHLSAHPSLFEKVPLTLLQCPSFGTHKL